jgi:hypothetical protein
MKRTLILYICSCCCTFIMYSQMAKTFQLNSGWKSPLPGTNTINEVLIRKDTVWFGTERGLSFTTNGGSSWTNFSNTGTFDNKGISAVAINDALIWVATGYSTKLNGESVQTGGGLHFSFDRGTTWSFVSQPVDVGTVDTLIYGNNKIRAMNVTVPQQNITFDIALTKNTVWIASWAGMLRKSTNLGTSWTRVILPPDNLDSIKPADSLNYAFDLSPAAGRLGLIANNNHLLFSVYASDDSTIWAGTAGGINKSTNGGLSWRKFSHQNQVHSISGNFVVALKEQRWKNRRIMWAATVNANDPDEIKGVSYTEDGGSTWKTALLGEWVHNIAVNDSGSVVYVASDNGLFRSSDVGESWTRSSSIYDPQNLQRFVSNECYGVGVKGDTVWFGGPEGTAYTLDSPSHLFGSVWHIFRTAEQVSSSNSTYAYPNPFTPSGESVRLHFGVPAASAAQDVSIRIFDYAMLPVRTLIQKVARPAGKEFDEIWNGRNDNNSIVANGVYFYRVEIGDQTPIWGKILVLR